MREEGLFFINLQPPRACLNPAHIFLQRRNISRLFWCRCSAEESRFCFSGLQRSFFFSIFSHQQSFSEGSSDPYRTIFKFIGFKRKIWGKSPENLNTEILKLSPERCKNSPQGGSKAERLKATFRNIDHLLKEHMLLQLSVKMLQHFW